MSFGCVSTKSIPLTNMLAYTSASNPVTLALLAVHLSTLCLAGASLPDRPFNVVWNVPSKTCKKKFGVDLKLEQYDIVVNPGQAFLGPYVSLIYELKLGMCPSYHDYHLDKAIHGGLPQTVDLACHKEKVADDIARLVPDADYQGLGIIDWESWRPLYERNWARKTIYRKQSQELVKERHPDLSEKEVKVKAREEFETAARAMMEDTLTLVKSLRPGGFWGFYLFPDCYNTPGSIRSRKGKTYGCPQKVQDQNDKLSWLWEASTGLYPSVYVTYLFKNMVNTEQFVRGKVTEAFRVMESRQGGDIPIYPYMWLSIVLSCRYREEIEYVTQADLVHSIGEIAGLGSAGVVIWGASLDVNSKEKCLQLEEYVRTVFGPYAKKITATAAECGERECSGHGRCVTNYETAISHEMMQGAGGLEQAQALQVDDFPDITQLTPEELAALDEEEDAPFFQAEDDEEPGGASEEMLEYFQQMELQPGREGVTCRCYSGWAGESCAEEL
ncbi:PREDICTED: hyaluronidase-1-like [Branchiostoma belcheri]|uniref:Hyaluronidase n=1 Tax=Branchiostoma belcheri TaxID=7741 RepID=A0A6P4YF66_BRABE|nr:PREDICTED: hyaluronidase-1-like [Branchiostoma belcheri]